MDPVEDFEVCCHFLGCAVEKTGTKSLSQQLLLQSLVEIGVYILTQKDGEICLTKDSELRNSYKLMLPTRTLLDNVAGTSYELELRWT